MHHRLGVRVAALAAALISPASQAAAALSGNQGSQLAASCTSCHGTNPNNGGIPSLGGLTEPQIIQAMTSFRTGKRDGPIMHIVASALSPEEIAAVANYLSSQRVKEESR